MGARRARGTAIFDLRGDSHWTGTTLARVGERESADWMIEHFQNPSEYSPGSIMPTYDDLSAAEMEALVRYLFELPPP